MVRNGTYICICVAIQRRRKDFLIGGAQCETTHRVVSNLYTTIYKTWRAHAPSAPPGSYTYAMLSFFTIPLVSQESDRSDRDDLTVFNMYGTCMLLRTSWLTLERKEFRGYGMKTEESEKAGSQTQDTSGLSY